MQIQHMDDADPEYLDDADPDNWNCRKKNIICIRGGLLKYNRIALKVEALYLPRPISERGTY